MHNFFSTSFFFGTKRRQKIVEFDTKYSHTESINGNSCTVCQLNQLFEHSLHCYGDITWNNIVTHRRQRQHPWTFKKKERRNYHIIRLFISFSSRNDRVKKRNERNMWLPTSIPIVSKRQFLLHSIPILFESNKQNSMKRNNWNEANLELEMK